MKKTLMIVLCLLLSACKQPQTVIVNYDFSLAVMENGNTGMRISYYDSEYQKLGSVLLKDRYVQPVLSVYSKPVCHEGYAYLQPFFAKGKKYEIIRTDLQNGSIDFIPLEAFDILSLYAGSDHLLAVQDGKNSAYYWLSEINWDGSEGEVTRSPDGDLAGMWVPLKDGWLRLKNVPDSRMIRYNTSFEKTGEKIIGESAPSMSETLREEAFSYHMDDHVIMNGSVYIPVHKENHVWELNDEGGYQRKGLSGYTFGIMKTDPDTLEYEILGDSDLSYQDIEPLDEKRIILSAAHQNIHTETRENEEVYYYDYSERQLVILDTKTGEFTSVYPEWQPMNLLRGKDVLYVTDTECNIHVLDPETLNETDVIIYTPDPDYSFAKLITSKPYGG